MKLVTSLCLALALVFATAACNDDTRRTGDGGADTGITLMDSGGGGDATTDSGGGTDTNRPDTGGGTCPPMTVPPPAGNVCEASTLTCLMGCADVACQDACFAADANNTACATCTNEAVISCASMNGCDDETGNLTCCGNDNGCADAACLMSMCSGEQTAFINCVNGVAMGPTCLPDLTACFMGS
jgi:hypothetical protein